jgi:hypothetical protein
MAARLEKALLFKRAVVIMFLNRRISNKNIEFRSAGCDPTSAVRNSLFDIRHSGFCSTLGVSQPLAELHPNIRA